MICIDKQMPTNCYDCWIRQNMGCRIANESGWLNDRRDDKCPLKAQEPRVMTWRDVIGAALECKPVYIEVKDSEDKERGDDRWAMITQYKDSMTNGMIRAMSSYVTSEILFQEDYSKVWRCWTSRPDEKRREETPWE